MWAVIGVERGDDNLFIINFFISQKLLEILTRKCNIATFTADLVGYTIWVLNSYRKKQA